MAVTAHRYDGLRPWHSGLLLMIVGAVAVFAGLVQTTVSHGGNENCPAGTTLVAKFEYSENHYVYAGPGNDQHVVTITNGTATGGNWSSTTAISYVIVKGGTGAVVMSIVPPQTSGHFSNASLPSVGNGNTPAVSNVQFCKPSGGTTTTTSSTTTSSSSTSTSTTSTTSEPPTTTTTVVPPTSTTTSTTTTEPPTTTTTSTTTTTEPPSTTTIPGETSTTISGATTTTTIPGETTTVEVSGSTVASSSTSLPVPIGPSAETSTSVYRNASNLPSGGLPRTGAPSALLITIGVLLIGAGLAISVVGFRRERGRV